MDVGSRPAASAWRWSSSSPRASSWPPQAERVPAVAAPGGPADRRRAVAADVDGDPAGPEGLGVGVGVGEAEELALERRALGFGVRPQGPHDVDALVGAPAPGGEIDPARFELFAHPPHPDAQPYPALGQCVQGGQAFGHDHRVVGREHEHPRGQLQAGGGGGQEPQHVDGVRDGAVVGQRHSARGGVGVAARVVADDHRVLDQDDGLEAAVLGVAGEADHPVGIRAHTGADGGEHGKFHDGSSMALSSRQSRCSWRSAKAQPSSWRA